MKKKVVIVCLSIIGVIGLCLGGFFLAKKIVNKDNNSSVVNLNSIVSTIILDINPSIKIYLDKDNKVIDVEAVNKDAEDIIYVEYRNKEYDYVLRKIVEKLVDKGYADGKITILVNTTGEIKADNVLEVVKQEFDAKEVEAEIIIQEISETASEIAKEYGISEVKASYIEEMINDNQELKYEDLKDKSVAELNDIKNNSNNKEEDKIGDADNKENNNTGSNGENSGSSNNDIDYSCNPPKDLKDSAWCEWNVKRHVNCEFDYPLKKSYEELNRIVYNYLGISESDQTGASGIPTAHKGTSYCETFKKKIIMRDGTVYTVEVDQVTGEIISSNKETPSYKITEEQAKKMALSYWHLNEEDCEIIGANRDLNGGPNGTYYRYQVNIMTKDGKNYSVDYDATTGEVMSSRTW